MKTLLLFALLLLPTAAFADSLHYTFSTTTGITGTFTFEDSTPFEITTGIVGSHHFPESQFPTPWTAAMSYWSPTSGSFGQYSFEGSGAIWYRDFHPPYDSAQDLGLQNYWIFHANLSSQMIGGRSLIGLHLFDYKYAWNDIGPNFLFPPPGDIGYPGNFQYGAEYSDGTMEWGALASLQLVPVPEPSSLTLLAIGAFGLVLKRKTSFRRSSQHPVR